MCGACVVHACVVRACGLHAHTPRHACMHACMLCCLLHAMRVRCTHHGLSTQAAPPGRRSGLLRPPRPLRRAGGRPDRADAAGVHVCQGAEAHRHCGGPERALPPCIGSQVKAKAAKHVFRWVIQPQSTHVPLPLWTQCSTFPGIGPEAESNPV